MKVTAFNDRIETKYQIDIEQREVAGLWRDLSSFLPSCGLEPVPNISSIGSVYFDNKDCDLLRFSLLGHLMLLRTRVYERWGQNSEPIKEYWIEVKTAQGARRKKRRFPLSKAALLEFIEGRGAAEVSAEFDDRYIDAELHRELYEEGQETLLTMGLQPILLVTVKRLAFQGEWSRLSIDWDVEYRYATTRIYDYTSWKYFTEPPAGKANKVILEMKCLVDGGVPPWFSKLQQRYPIFRREYLKPVEGMGFLFEGPLKQHKEADYFLSRIKGYMENSLLA